MNRDCWENCTLGSCPEYPCEAIGEEPIAFWVYLTNRLSGDPGEYLANVAELSAKSRRLMDLGFCPINPAGDLLEGLASPEALPVPAYQRRSLELLRLCSFALPRAAVYAINDHKRDGRASGGVAGEHELARELRIPIVRSEWELLELRRCGA